MTKESGHLSDEQKWQLLSRHEKLGEILLKRGMLTLKELSRLIDKQKKADKPLGELIVSEGILTKYQVIKALEWQQQSAKVEQQAIDDLKKQKEVTAQYRETCQKLSAQNHKQEP